jgi:hypothetical protein
MDALTKQHHTAESSRIEEKHKAVKIAVEILQTLRQKLQCLSTFMYHWMSLSLTQHLTFTLRFDPIEFEDI